jgi:hypothetical protein
MGHELCFLGCLNEMTSVPVGYLQEHSRSTLYANNHDAVKRAIIFEVTADHTALQANVHIPIKCDEILIVLGLVRKRLGYIMEPATLFASQSKLGYVTPL